MDSIKDVKIDEIVIGGDRLAPRYTNLSTTNQFLTKEQIDLVQPEKVMDRLVLLPGVLNATNAIGGPSLVIRGQDQNRINVFFNGIPIRSNTENNIPMDNFFFSNSDVFLEKGSSSLIFGANSGGSVIRFENRLNFEEDFGINIKSFIGNNGKQSYNLNLTGNYSKKLFYLLSGNFYSRNSFRLSEKFDTIPSQRSRNRNNSDQQTLELLGILAYNINQNNIISITGMFNNGDYGYAPSITRPRFRRMTQFRNSVIGLRTVSDIKKDLRIESNVYFTSLNDTLSEFTNDTYTIQRRYSHWIDETIGGRFILSKEFSRFNQLNISFDAKQDIHSQDWYNINATTKANTFITAFEYQTSLVKRLNINTGVSYNIINPFYTSKGELPEINLSALNYQISLAYIPLDYLYKIHLGYSRTTIFPRMRDLFGIDMIPGFVPNPNLKEETNDNFDFGISSAFLNNKISASLSFFYNPIRNLIVDVRLTDTTTQTQNLNSAKFFGSEVMIKITPSEKFFANLSYTFLKSVNLSANRTSDYIAYRPEHHLKAFLTYSPIQFFGITATITHISKQFYDNITNWASIPDYTIFDLGIQSKFLTNATFWAKINNVFDENCFSVFDQPQAGREFRIGLTIDFKVLKK